MRSARHCLYIFIIIVITCSGCDKKEPVKIGFSGCLTGSLSDLGIGGRNGVILATEQINVSGGIHGRPVELIVRDDHHDTETAVQADKELIQKGVTAIIGHMTSTMSMAAVPLINKEKIVMISPTTSTDTLTGIDDYFLRLCPQHKTEAAQLAEYAFNKLKLKKMASIYDLSNPVFCERLYNNFKQEFERIGGSIIFSQTFLSGKDTSYMDMVNNLMRSEPDGLMIIGGSLDTAMLCQQIRKLGSDIPVISSGWACTSDLIRYGGKAVEHVIFSQFYDKEGKQPRYLNFKKEFFERFGREPDFAAAFSYESAQFLFKALSESSKPENLKDAMLRVKKIEGLQGEIRMDKYGDVMRKRFIVTIKDGRFQTAD